MRQMCCVPVCTQALLEHQASICKPKKPLVLMVYLMTYNAMRPPFGPSGSNSCSLSPHIQSSMGGSIVKTVSPSGKFSHMSEFLYLDSLPACRNMMSVFAHVVLPSLTASASVLTWPARPMRAFPLWVTLSLTMALWKI